MIRSALSWLTGAIAVICLSMACFAQEERVEDAYTRLKAVYEKQGQEAGDAYCQRLGIDKLLEIVALAPGHIQAEGPDDKTQWKVSGFVNHMMMRAFAADPDKSQVFAEGQVVDQKSNPLLRVALTAWLEWRAKGLANDKEALRIVGLFRRVYEDDKDEGTVRERAVRSAASVVYNRAYTRAYRAASEGDAHRIGAGAVADVWARMTAKVVGEELWAGASAVKKDAIVLLRDAAEPEVVRKGAAVALTSMARIGEHGVGDGVSKDLKKVLADVSIPVSVRVLAAQVLCEAYNKIGIQAELMRCLEDAERAKDKDTAGKCQDLLADIKATKIQTDKGGK